MKLLFIEDDARLANLIKEYLEKYNFNVVWVDNGVNVEQIIKDVRPDIIILDMMLPVMDGMEICRQIRHKFTGPILFLTAQDDSMDEVAALELGADDYIHKPIEPRVLLAKLKAVSRRINTEVINKEKISFDGLVLDCARREVVFENTHIELSSTEYELLLIFTENAGLVMSRDELSEKLRGISYDGLDRSIDIAVSRLRKKLTNNSNIEMIKTVWGKGYLFTGGKSV